ncbi:MAG: zinc ABC transporter substrate-binding protein [Gammaproteobacteria bacterium]|nr:zinc ABC transporter substrate-binding protein [Gammaproteobacteria bacterium]
MHSPVFIRRFRRAFQFALLLAAASLAPVSPARAAPPEVVVSILPLHSLTANLMRGVGTPHLLMPAGQSPHGGQLKPSQVRWLDGADLIVWVGPSFEQSLAKSIAGPRDQKSGGARVVTLLQHDSLLRLPVREGGLWEAHDHAHGDDEHGDEHGDEHAHEEHDAHDEHAHGDAHDDHDEHDHGGAHKDEHDEHGHENHGHNDDDHGHGHETHGHNDEHHRDHGGHGDHDDHAGDHADDHHANWRIDPHIWLSVANARAIVDILARELTAVDPANAAQYDANRRDALAQLAALRREVAGRLGAVRGRRGARYVVFHDAYHYFEHEFNLQPLGALTVSPERPPGARRIRDIKQAIRARGARCVFSEPQFQPDLARTLAADTGAKTAVLDPLGAALTPGPQAWFDLMRALTAALTDCLK